MKRIYYIVIIIIGSMFFNSCSDDLLDKTPLDEISDEDFWKTEGDLQLYLNTLYGEFPGWEGDGTAPSHDIGTDIISESQLWFGTSSTNRLDGTGNLPTTGGGWTWSNIRSVNYFLENVDRVESGELIDHYKGEGYFFRAYFYFELLTQFGDLPIVTKVVQTDDDDILYGRRESRTDVVNFILSDLDLAIANMKTVSDVGDSRLNRDIASLFKARVALYEGTWEKYHEGTEFAGDTDGSLFLEQAHAAAYNVIESGNYSLYTADGNTDEAYYDLFIQTDYNGHSEVMLYKHYDYLTYNIKNFLWNQPNLQGMTREMTKNYLASDGMPISVSPNFIGDATLSEIQVNRDPRLGQTIMAPGDLDYVSLNGDDIAFNTPNMTRNPTGYSIEKWRSKEILADQENHRTSDIGYIIFRYAEALLIFAEAKAELGILTQADVDISINKLRDRVGMPHLNLASITQDPNWPDYGYTLTDYQYEVRRERVVELFGEGNRLDDLMRWRAHKLFVGTRPLGTTYTSDIEDLYPGLMVDNDGFIDPFVNYLNGGAYGFDASRDYLLPLPTNELTTNPALIQNPNW
ncbi:RagB/SusD family nutrient uptake outer membrane protein [Formosa undariae]|uniref:RagB/SusD family nutrient uptake outer membrane protein n=1 Tax=Formosa undariae TaxID=1325436 RepID=A0ABV5F5U6_9FLAO